MDIEEGLERYRQWMGRQVQCVMSWVRSCASGDMLEAFGPRAEDGEDRRHGLEVWTVSGSQIRLSNEDKSKTDLCLKKLSKLFLSKNQIGASSDVG